MTEPLDVLAAMAHPDDAEMLCGGALIKSADAGERTGALDLTAGEAGSRGTPESRAREAAEAAEIMGLAVRRCADLADAGLVNDRDSRTKVAALLRELRPRVVVTHWKRGRHPDHRVAAELVRDASFLAGLGNFPCAGKPHRPRKIVHALAFRDDDARPAFVVDVTAQMDRKLAALEVRRRGRHGRGPAGGQPTFDGADPVRPRQVRSHDPPTVRRALLDRRNDVRGNAGLCRRPELLTPAVRSPRPDRASILP